MRFEIVQNKPILLRVFIFLCSILESSLAHGSDPSFFINKNGPVVTCTSKCQHLMPFTHQCGYFSDCNSGSIGCLTATWCDSFQSSSGECLIESTRTICGDVSPEPLVCYDSSQYGTNFSCSNPFAFTIAVEDETGSRLDVDVFQTKGGSPSLGLPVDGRYQARMIDTGANVDCEFALHVRSGAWTNGEQWNAVDLTLIHGTGECSNMRNETFYFYPATSRDPIVGFAFRRSQWFMALHTDSSIRLFRNRPGQFGEPRLKLILERM